MTPLPLPKHRLLRIVVADIYVLCFLLVPYLCWILIRHKHVDWFHVGEWVLIIALTSVTVNGDYYDLRNRYQASYKITPDRDEAQPARKAIDN